MGNLPKPRLTVTRPFTHTGVDYAGPFTLKLTTHRSVKTHKAYVALFICLSTKAIHLEVVSDLTSQAFIAAFKRFISRRGAVSHLYSDNATNFIGASKILSDALTQSQYINEVTTALATEGMQWHFIPPASPHFGGLWEAGIKATKHHMKRVIGESILTFEEMTTLMTMIEACLNSRPLCPLSNDPESLNVLTPGHFLVGSPLLAVPQESLLDKQPNLLTRWHILERMHQDFWKQWSSEYLSRLQQRPKWVTPQPNLQIGNIVLIKEENLPPTKWALGRIIEVHPGTDGLVRVVTVRTQSTVIKRPVTKVALLPITDNEDHSTSDTSKQQPPSTQENRQHPTSKGVSEGEQLLPTQVTDHNYKRKHQHSSNKGNSKRSRHARHQPTSYPAYLSTMIVLILHLFILVVLGEQPTNSYKITPFKNDQGIFFETVADTNIYSNEWTLIVHLRLDSYKTQLTAIRNSASQLTAFCERLPKEHTFKKHCLSTTTQLNHQLAEIEDSNQLLLQQDGQSTIRKRHAPLGFVGNLASSLFGVLDEEYAERYEQQIHKLQENEGHLKELLQKQTSIADATVNIIKKGQQDIQQQYSAIKRQLSDLQEQLNETNYELNLSGTFNSAVVLVILDMNSIRHIQQALLSVLTDTRHGRINTLLLTPAQLNDQLKTIRQHLPRDLKIPEAKGSNLLLTLYTLMQVRTRVTDRNMLFEIRIPLMNAEYYKIYHLIPIPMTLSGQFVYIQPSSKYLLVNTHRDRYSPMSEADLTTCRQWDLDHLLCKFNLPLYNLRANVSRCEMELLLQEGKLSTFCDIRSTQTTVVWIKMHTPNSWVYLLDKPTSFDVLCGAQIEPVTLEQRGIFQLSPGCLIKHATMIIAANNRITGSINSSFVLETNIPTDILNSGQNNATSRTLPVINKEVSSRDLEHLQTMINEQRNELNKTGNLSVHDLHHYTGIYISIGICIIIIAIYYKRRRATITPVSSLAPAQLSSSGPVPSPRHAFE